ncbi:PEP-CTERM sorting domain-containing protein [Salinisphaera hydrothermalis]|uniref:PEP-CTERM sorting domain-containing protein n=1 Tax=Salinisphaera hydrothermalis TaxID=563188 RepID=UPI003340B03E
MHFKHLAVSSATAFALGLCGSASASVINFDQANAQSPAGTVSYDGEGGALTGSGISFGEVRLNGGSTPGDHQNTLTCNSCSIDFTTGNNLSEGNEDQIWKFAGGGNLTLSGEVVNNDGQTVAHGTLFKGTFDNGGTQVVIGNGSNSFNASLSGKDEFNSDLASYFGLNNDTGLDFSSTAIALGNATFGGDGSFDSGQLQNADVTVESNDVPEPSPFGIFAVGLALVAGGLGFRRKQHGGAA